jgi:chromosome segregation ATPase
MNYEWLVLFAGAVVLSAAGFVTIAVIWLRKLRETVGTALSEAAGQQIRTAQRLAEQVAQLQKQQDGYSQQINILAQAGMRLQQELSNVANRLENAQGEVPRGNHTMH